MITKASEQIFQQATNNLNKAMFGNAYFWVTAYGAKGDGVSDDSAKILATVNAAAVSGGIVFFPSSSNPYRISSNFTVPSNVTLLFVNGSRLSIDTGITVTINGPIQAGLHQIFSGLGSIIGSIKVHSVFPQWWGAKGDGINDDTAAIQNALNYMVNGGVLFFPVGKYKVSSTLNVSNRFTVLSGADESTTRLVANGSFDILNVTAGDTGVFHLGFESSIVQASGRAIYLFNVAGFRCQNVIFNTYAGLEWNGGANGFIRDVQGGQTKASFIKLYAASGSLTDVFIDMVNVQAAAGVGGSGLELGGGCSGIYVNRCNFMSFVYGVYIHADGASYPQYVYMNNVLGDTSSDNGIYITGGKILRFVHCWGCTAVHYGWRISGGSDICLTSCDAGNNGFDGILIETSGENGAGVSVENCNVWSNSTSGVSSFHGIHVANAASYFKITNNKCGRGVNNFTATQGYGIYVNSGASDHYIIANNLVFGNQAGSVADSGTGTNKAVVNNVV